ncbi:MAG TPA: Ig-like domain-containing protein [Alphaproteobacteria bacterium]|jgi:hypothetical protein|nr:Ig-like domain-containing protein [Alphaproteobacteria bacterium]
MKSSYSRLASVEEKKNLKKVMIFGGLTVLIIILLLFVGIPILGNFTAFISDLGKANKPITSNDKTPPAPPRFNQFSDFTNQKSITISGNSEAGVNIKIVFNGKEKTSLTDKDGNFSFNFDLLDGDNNFVATAIDTAGNISQKTKEYKIVFDNKNPDLTLDSPADGSSFFGTQQRQVTIQGTTEADSKVTINDRIISVDENGKFQYTTTLNDGENKFTVKTSDQAGNTTEKTLVINFSS